MASYTSGMAWRAVCPAHGMRALESSTSMMGGAPGGARRMTDLPPLRGRGRGRRGGRPQAPEVCTPLPPAPSPQGRGGDAPTSHRASPSSSATVALKPMRRCAGAQRAQARQRERQQDRRAWSARARGFRRSPPPADPQRTRAHARTGDQQAQLLRRRQQDVRADARAGAGACAAGYRRCASPTRTPSPISRTGVSRLRATSVVSAFSGEI